MFRLFLLLHEETENISIISEIFVVKNLFVVLEKDILNILRQELTHTFFTISNEGN